MPLRKKANDYYKELIRDKTSGDLREITPGEKAARDQAFAEERRKRDESLRRQMNMDRMVMTPEAFRKKWGGN